MQRGPAFLAAVASIPEVRPELVRPLVAALEGTDVDATVDASEVGRDQTPRWLLPTGVTVLFHPSLLADQVLEQLHSGTDRSVTATLVALYADVDAIRRTALVPAGLRPLGLDFRGSPRELFRFVLDIGLQPDEVSQALADLPRALHDAIARLQRSKNLVGAVAEFDREAGQSLGEEPSFELVHLYEDPVHRWELIA